jgi:CheY-like chemotaxis protein
MREILLVEDSEADADLVCNALKRLNIANPVRVLRDGLQALSFLGHAEQSAALGPPVPSVLFLDMKLPGMSGFEILQRVKGPAFSRTLRVILSNLDDTKSIKQAYSLGANSYLVKPFRDADLAELIKVFPAYWSFKDSLMAGYV